MDRVSPKKRSEIMQAIKSRDSKMELFFRKELSKRGLRYRKHVSRLPGKPDIVFVKKRAAIFLDSCFWHGCKKHCRLPASNKRYWIEKIERNKKRDKFVNKKYDGMGWKILRVWEHDINANTDAVVSKIVRKAK